MIRREELRLRRVFAAAIAAAIPGVGLGACSHDPTLAETKALDAQSDQTTETTTGLSAVDSNVTVDASCSIEITLTDSGLDGDAYADPGCTYVNSCGVPAGVITLGCQVYLQSGEQPDAYTPNGCWVISDAGCQEDVYTPAAPFLMQCPDCTSSGRATTAVFARNKAHSHASLGEAFAAMAHAEAVSVIAFDTLRRELSHYGAPDIYLRNAARAARDEAEHTRILSALASAAGAVPLVPRKTRMSPRSLFAIALENAIEGCTNETFGALLMQARARLTPRRSLQSVFKKIGDDETRHAAFSFALAKWLSAKLSPTERRRVNEAQENAQRGLERAIRSRRPAAYDVDLGYPGAAALTLAKSLAPLSEHAQGDVDLSSAI